MSKQIYLICCVDEGDNTKMVLCASSNHKPIDENGKPLTTLVNNVTALFGETETTEEEIADIIENIVAFGEAETEEYSFFTETTFLD